jgi:hypothetical protein
MATIVLSVIGGSAYALELEDGGYTMDDEPPLFGSDASFDNLGLNDLEVEFSDPMASDSERGRAPAGAPSARYAFHLEKVRVTNYGKSSRKRLNSSAKSFLKIEDIDGEGPEGKARAQRSLVVESPQLGVLFRKRNGRIAPGAGTVGGKRAKNPPKPGSTMRPRPKNSRDRAPRPHHKRPPSLKGPKKVRR